MGIYQLMGHPVFFANKKNLKYQLIFGKTNEKLRSKFICALNIRNCQIFAITIMANGRRRSDKHTQYTHTYT